MNFPKIRTFKKLRFPGSAFVLILFVLFLGAPALAKGGSNTHLRPPFQDGESLKYQLKWIGIPIATLRLSTQGPLSWNGKRVFRYQARFKSIGLLKRLYRVDDHAVSVADAQKLHSYRIDIRQKEGRYRAQRWNIFEPWRTVYGRPKRPPRHYDVFGELNDMLSAVYKARTLQLRPGKETDVYVFHGKYLYRVFLHVTGREQVDTLWGKVTALVIKPRIAGKNRLNDLATTWIWVTDDQFRIPVRLESRTYMGSFVSHLIETRKIPAGRLAKAPALDPRKWKPRNMRLKQKEQGSVSDLRKLLKRKKIKKDKTKK